MKDVHEFKTTDLHDVVSHARCLAMAMIEDRYNDHINDHEIEDGALEDVADAVKVLHMCESLDPYHVAKSV